MQAIIMAGGEGSRLRPLTCDCPKPMLPLLGKPLMEYAVELLLRSGCTHIGATLGYLPDAIMQHFGTGARWNTANVESFFSLPWDARHAQIIKAQMESAREQMIVPGGYFTGRHIINAWNSVVVNNKDARDMLEKAVKDINKELDNKRKEFGLDN